MSNYTQVKKNNCVSFSYYRDKYLKYILRVISVMCPSVVNKNNKKLYINFINFWCCIIKL